MMGSAWGWIRALRAPSVRGVSFPWASRRPMHRGLATPDAPDEAGVRDPEGEPGGEGW